VAARTQVPFDPSVVAPWTAGSGSRGALLIHGFASTPPELRRLGDHLAAAGWRCHAPALDGHASTPEALERTTWRDWTASAQRAFDELASVCAEVMVAGQSMGGTVALHLAATDLRVRAVATLSAPLRISGHLHHLLPLFVPFMRWYQPGDDVDLWDPTAVEELYTHGRRATRSIRELKRLLAHVRDELVQVRAPVLILHGDRDRTVAPSNADELERRLVSSVAVQRVAFARSGHALSVDVDRDAVNDLVARWFERYSAGSRREERRAQRAG
jgi:carboxylesterase